MQFQWFYPYTIPAGHNYPWGRRPLDGHDAPQRPPMAPLWPRRPSTAPDGPRRPPTAPTAPTALDGPRRQIYTKIDLKLKLQKILLFY
jgi:hypothetical protein